MLLTAVELSKSIVERYGATPYGFCFETFGRNAEDLDSKRIATSSMYFLGGKIETVEDIGKSQPGSILLANMKCNGWKAVITSTSGYHWTQPFSENNVISGCKRRGSNMLNTVAQLKEALSQYPDDMEVVVKPDNNEYHWEVYFAEARIDQWRWRSNVARYRR